jgi:spore maturation protein CgeB
MKVIFFRQLLGILDEDLIRALIKKGTEVMVEDIKQSLTPEGHFMEMFSEERIHEMLDTFRPDCIMTLNGSGVDNTGVISREYERRGIPYITWFVDRPRAADFGGKYSLKNSHFFLFDQFYLPVMTKAGFSQVHYLPLATDPDRFRPLEDVEKEDRVCFIGELDYKTIQYLARNIDAMVEGADENFYACVEQAIRAQLERPGEDTWVIVSETLKEGGIDTGEFPQVFRDILEGFVEREAGLRLRMETMKAVSQQYPVAVYGEPLWQEVVGDGYRGRVSYRNDDIVRVYNRYPVHINLSRFQLRSAINQRPFDVSACGGFLLTDYRDDIRKLFAPDEIVVFRSTDELLTKVRIFSENEGLRGDYARKARERVLAEHTYGHRVDEIFRKVLG